MGLIELAESRANVAEVSDLGQRLLASFARRVAALHRRLADRNGGTTRGFLARGLTASRLDDSTFCNAGDVPDAKAAVQDIIGTRLSEREALVPDPPPEQPE